MSGKSLMNGGEESYSGVVPTKQPNKGEKSRAEVVEGRPLAKENTQESNPNRTQGRRNRAKWARACAGGNKTLPRQYPRQEPCALAVPARVCAGGGE